MEKARTVLGLPSGLHAEEYRILAMLLCLYQNHWQQHDSLLYYRMQLYVLTAGGGHTEVLRRHHNYPIVGHFSAKRTLELVSRKYY